MRILITGASGFVGSHMVRRILSEQLGEVHVWLRNTADTWRISDLVPQVGVHNVDITDAEGVRESIRTIRPDIVYHFANLGIYGGQSENPDRVRLVNEGGFRNIETALRTIPYTAFINVGSSSEYGPKLEPMKESDPCEPQSEYARSKLAATEMAIQAGKEGYPVVTLRLFSPFGPYDDGRRLISRVILSLLTNSDMHVPHARAVRDYMYIDDVIDVLYEAMGKALANRGEVFNVGTGIEKRAIDVVREIAAILKQDEKVDTWVQTDIESPLESPRWQADMSKTFSEFSSRPKYSLSAGLQSTIDWFQRNRSHYVA